MRIRIPGVGSPAIEIDASLLARGAPPAGNDGLVLRGCKLADAPPGDHTFGRAQMVRVTDEGLSGLAADPRSSGGECAGR